MSKPLALTEDVERVARECNPTVAWMEVDALRAALARAEADLADCDKMHACQCARVEILLKKLADERRHADALAGALRDPDSITVERAIEAHHARRAAEKEVKP